MTRQRSAVTAAIVGVLLVAMAKALLFWTYGHPTPRTSGLHPGTGYTLTDIGFKLQYVELGNHLWQLAYDRWLLWTLLMLAGLLALVALTVRRSNATWKGLALLAALAGAVASAVQAWGLVGVRFPIYYQPPGPTFHGVGPGPVAAVGGFLVLGLAVFLAPVPTTVEPGPLGRTFGALALTGSGVALALWSINGLAWWDVGKRDQPSPFGFHELLGYLGFAGSDVSTARFVRYGLCPLVVVAATCVLATLLRPEAGRALRPLAVVAGVLAPVLTVINLAYVWRGALGSPSYPPSHNPLVSMVGGFWVLTAGALLIAAAAVVAPGQKTMPQWGALPSGPKASEAA